MIRKIKSLIRKADAHFLKGRLRKGIRKIMGKSDIPEILTRTTYASQTEEYFNDPAIRQQLENVDPKRIVCSGRLDVIVRYLLFRDIAFGRESDAHKSLYCRTILTRTGAIEPTGFFAESDKGGVETHIQLARELCQSIRVNGFKEEYYIPIANDFGLYNGAHRLACAMALDENVWVRKCGNHGIRDMDFKWLCDNGFSLEDKIRILRGFADIHKNCGMYVLYGAARERWDYLESYIGKRMQIVGTIDLDFSKDYIAFENLIHDIYHDYDSKSCIGEKVNLLKFADLVVRILLVSDEKEPDANLYENIRKTKVELRQLLGQDYAEGAYVTLHGSDSREEFEDLKQIILSVNNLKHLRLRMNSRVREEFLDWLRDFKEYCKVHGIDVADTCIVGSSPLEVMGIRDSTDIDIMISPELRSIYGDGITHLTPTLDIGTRNYVRNNDTVLIWDEQLIYDDDCHFMFMGCKFANVEHVLYRKASSEREKDIKDVRLIKIFFEYARNFDDKIVLQQQIQRELARRGLVKKKRLIV